MAVLGAADTDHKIEFICLMGIENAEALYHQSAYSSEFDLGFARISLVGAGTLHIHTAENKQAQVLSWQPGDEQTESSIGRLQIVGYIHEEPFELQIAPGERVLIVQGRGAFNASYLSYLIQENFIPREVFVDGAEDPTLPNFACFQVGGIVPWPSNIILSQGNGTSDNE